MIFYIMVQYFYFLEKGDYLILVLYDTFDLLYFVVPHFILFYKSSSFCLFRFVVIY